ncbi:MAG: hypothetical protein E7350_04455 [Clostridiales bacterium]|nr:hypothetical protein [Clostridiales bacterium]
MNNKEKLKFVKRLFLEILKDRVESEEIKELIDKAKTVEDIIEILKNKNLTPLEKDIELVKMIVKENIKKNQSIGVFSKMALIAILEKNQPVKNILFELVDFINTKDLRK